MRTLARVIFLVTLAFGLLGCEARIDGSSEEAFLTSVEEMNEGLTDQEKDELGKALKTITLKDISWKKLMAGSQSGDTLADEVRRTLDGKSRQEILDMAQKIRAKRKNARDEALKEAEAEDSNRGGIDP